MSSEDVVKLATAALEDIKAQDILAIDVRDKTSIADYMLIATGDFNSDGNADLVVNLSSSSLGSNGLLVIKSASGTGHSLPLGTTLVSNSFFTKTGGFQNGTLSFFLFSSTSAFTNGTDYDTFFQPDGTASVLYPFQSFNDVPSNSTRHGGAAW